MRKTIVVIITLIAGYILLTAPYFDMRYYKSNIPQQIYQSSWKAYESGDKNISLNQIIAGEFKWDKVFIFTPYTTRDLISQKLGITWFGRDLRDNDSDNLLIFTYNSRVAAYTVINRRLIDFKTPDSNDYEAPRDKSQFEVGLITENCQNCENITRFKLMPGFGAPVDDID